MDELIKFVENIDEIKSLKYSTVFRYKCRMCGTIVTSKYQGIKRIHRYESFLCKSCKRLDELSKVSDNSIPIIVSLNDYLNIGTEQKYRFYCKHCDTLTISTKASDSNTIARQKRFLCGKCNFEQSSLENYGTTHPMKNRIVVEKLEQNNLKKWGKKHPQCYGSDERKELMNERYGVDYAMQNPELKDKCLNSNKSHNNGMLYTQTNTFKEEMSEMNKQHPEWHERSLKSNRDNHGGLHNMQTEEGVRNQQESDRKKHGGLLYCQTEEFADYMREMHYENPEWHAESQRSNRNNHGGLHNTQTPEGREICRKNAENNTNFGSSKRLYYDDYNFDSSTELALYIFCKLNNIPVTRLEMEIQFAFVDMYGKLRHVHPDFIIDGKLVEVKGGHFFKPDGTMFCPFNRLHENSKEFTPDEKMYWDDYFERKRLCLLENGVTILKSDCEYLENVVQYVERIFHSKNWFKPYVIKYYSFKGCGNQPYGLNYSKEYQEPIGFGDTPFTI